MIPVNRMPPRTPVAVTTVSTAQATVPHGSDPSHANPSAAAPTHGHHHAHHHHEGHAHAPQARHAGPAPKPRRPPKPTRKNRRRAAGSPMGDDDELDIGGEEAHQVGAPAVSFDGGHQDGGDNHEQGGGDSRREDRTLRARFDEKGPAPAEARRRCVDTSYIANRYHRGIGEVLVGPDGSPDMAARLRKLDLELLRAMPDAARLDQGGLARARANLIAHSPPAPAANDRPSPDSAAGRANCIAVMKELQLQHRRTAEGRQRAIAHLEVRQRSHPR